MHIEFTIPVALLWIVGLTLISFGIYYSITRPLIGRYVNRRYGLLFQHAAPILFWTASFSGGPIVWAILATRPGLVRRERQRAAGLRRNRRELGVGVAA